MKSVREREILYDIIFKQNLKRNDTNKLTCKTEADSWLPRGKGRGGDNLKWIINKNLLYSTGNSAQYFVTT